MKLIITVVTATILFSAPRAAAFSGTETDKDRPHIVLFISDDLGWADTSVHGSPDARTPTLDRLAAEGMVFNQAYAASPSCCPNRWTLLTGLMPARHGAHPNHSQVRPEVSFLLPILRNLGYYTASFGKVAHGRNRFDGLDYFSASPRSPAAGVRAWLAQYDGDRPVCLLVGDRRPHVPWVRKTPYDPDSLTIPDHLIDTPETRSHRARYLADVSGVDAEAGRVLDACREFLGPDVMFVFSSDHGAQWPFGKWNLYDSGIRVPLIVVHPGQVPAGVRTDAMVSWADLLPTMIDIAGGTVSDDIDGRSFASVLAGTASTHRERIFTTHTGDGVMNIYPMRSVRTARWKYIRNLCPDAWHTNHSDRLRKEGAGAYWDSWDAAAAESPRAAALLQRYYTRPAEELFDLSLDPDEQTNLAGSPTYQSQLRQFRQQVNDRATEQEDDLKPHREPHPRSLPLPNLR